MQRFLVIALFALLAADCTNAQQAKPPLPPAHPQPVRVKVYPVGGEVKPATLIPLDVGQIPKAKCDMRQRGTVEFSLLIDTTGHPRNIMFLRPLGTDLDRFALNAANVNLFNPGTLGGKPVVVAASLQIDVDTCVEISKDAKGNPVSLWHLRSPLRQKLRKLRNPPEEAVLAPIKASWKESSRPAPRSDYFGGEVTPPVVLIGADPLYTPKARREGIKGVCAISLTVDPNGLPENVKVLRPLDPGLDQNAIIAVSQFRFFPAIKNGEPVAAVITIDMQFAPPEAASPISDFE